MKRLFILLLTASLAVNAYCLIQHFRRTPADADNSSADPAASSADAVPAFSSDTWALVKSGDDTSPTRLRALGFPDSILSAVVRAEANARYRDRETALRSQSLNYWQRGYRSFGGASVVKDRAAAVDLAREKEAELKRLLGDAYQPDNKQLGSTASFLPADKAEQLRLLEEDYSVMQSNRSSYNMVRLPEDAERQRYLQQQRRADIVALLTPEELQAYDYRMSPTASFLRYNLSGFDMTEQEFQTLYTLRKPLEAFNGTASMGYIPDHTPENAKAQREAQAAVDTQIKTALGETRYADYKRSQDYEFRTLTSLAKRLELPREKAVEGYNLKLALEQKAKTFKPQPGTDEKQQRANFNAALLREAETAFTALYGEKGYAAIRDRVAARIQPNPR